MYIVIHFYPFYNQYFLNTFYAGFNAQSQQSGARGTCPPTGCRGRAPAKGPHPLKIIPALTTCASKQMKTHRFSHFACIAAWSECERQSTRKARKVAVCHFSTLNAYLNSLFYYLNISPDPVGFPIQSSGASKKTVPPPCFKLCHYLSQF